MNLGVYIYICIHIYTYNIIITTYITLIFLLFHPLHRAKFPQTKKIPQISQAKKAGASSLQKICEEAMVGCFYDFGECFLQPDGCSLKLPPTWSHCSPCAKVVWGLEAQVHGPFSPFHRVENLKTHGLWLTLRWLTLTTKKEIWMIWPWKEIGVPWSLGYLVVVSSLGHLESSN